MPVSSQKAMDDGTKLKITRSFQISVFMHSNKYGAHMLHHSDQEKRCLWSCNIFSCFDVERDERANGSRSSSGKRQLHRSVSSVELGKLAVRLRHLLVVFSTEMADREWSDEGRKNCSRH